MFINFDRVLKFLMNF